MTHALRTIVAVTLVVLFAFVASAAPPAAASDRPAGAELAGPWQGSLDLGEIRLRLVFHLEAAHDGGYTATLDSPDQGATGIPASRVAVDEGAVEIEVAAIGGAYSGRLAADGESVEGEWRQGGTTLPLRLERVDGVAEVRRPQEPRPPYPYTEEEVTVEVPKADGVTLAGTLTLPPGDGPHPAVVLVSGSGPQDRDETLAGYRPFLVLADHLGRRGVAVLRLDDRGVGGSTGSTPESTLGDRADDALAAVRYLRGRSEVDGTRVGLVGHSEGGWVAPLVAVEAPDRVAFVVMLAGPAQSPRDLLRSQRRALLEAQEVDGTTVTALLTLQERAFAVLDETPDPAAARSRIEGLREAVLADLPEDQRAGLAAYFADRPEAERGLMVETVTTPWFRDLLAFDPAPVLRRLDVPLLALYGDRDLQVPAAENAPLLRRMLGEDRGGEHTVRVLPGRNHLFQPSETGLPAEYFIIETTIDPEVLELVGDWIAETAGRGRPM